MNETPIKKKILQILDILGEEYGIPEWQPRHDPVSVLVQTILSQNTSDTNSRGAFQALLASFDNWEGLADADIDTIAHRIRCGGLGRVKAQRIKQSLEEIAQRRGQLKLDFLSQLILPDAQAWLLKLPGVGLKTACCVLTSNQTIGVNQCPNLTT